MVPRVFKRALTNSFTNDLRSAHKRFHSTDTALLNLKMANDNTVFNMDNSKLTVLSFLCLCAAFGATDHDILLQRLHRYFGYLAQPFKDSC